MIAAVVAIAVGFRSGTTAQPTAASIAAAMDKVWAKYGSSDKLVGMCAGAVDGRVAMAKCYGVGAKGGTPADVRTLFRIESVSKTFAATLLALRVQQGVVKLDDPVRMYVPVLGGQPLYPQTLTLAQLAEHYSGLPKKTPKESGLNAFFVDTGSCLAKASCRNDVPGHSYLYSNWAFLLLGNVLSVKDGFPDGPLGPWEPDNVRSIARPLGMLHTRSLPDWVIHHAAYFSAHVATSGKENDTSAPYGDPGGGLYSDARDMLKWLRYSMGLSGPSDLRAAQHLLYDDAISNNLKTRNPDEVMGLAWEVNTSPARPASGRAVTASASTRTSRS
jgi:CubicO group peptidase (beta-lactamase class C family)